MITFKRLLLRLYRGVERGLEKKTIQCTFDYPDLDYPDLDYPDLDYPAPRLSRFETGQGTYKNGRVRSLECCSDSHKPRLHGTTTLDEGKLCDPQGLCTTRVGLVVVSDQYNVYKFHPSGQIFANNQQI